MKKSRFTESQIVAILRMARDAGVIAALQAIVVRACQIARLSRAAYYRPGVDVIDQAEYSHQGIAALPGKAAYGFFP